MDYDPSGDLYTAVLGISHIATPDEIRRAHRERIKALHPDKPGGNAARAAELNRARDVLLDSHQRVAYDAARSAYLTRRQRQPPPRPMTSSPIRSSSAHSFDAATSAADALAHFADRVRDPKLDSFQWWLETVFWGAVTVNALRNQPTRKRGQPRPAVPEPIPVGRKARGASGRKSSRRRRSRH